MTGLYTKEDAEYFKAQENQMLFEFNLIFTSNEKIFDRTPEMAKERDKILKEFFKKHIDKAKEANFVPAETLVMWNFGGEGIK